ncbi:MAG: TonB-dependent receptor [Microscillaceae bacterium]
MQQIFLLFLLLVYPGLTGFAQKGQVSGQVKSKGEALAWATLHLKNKNLGTTSDEAGNFQMLDIPWGEYWLEVSMLGYSPQSQKIVLTPQAPLVTLVFELSELTTDLADIVVSGTLLPVSKAQCIVPVEVYSPAFFRANPAPSVFESLQNINGVRPQFNCNICNTGDIHLNGLEGPYTMVMIDGMPIVSGLSTVYGLTGIPQSLIERIEIVKGPASTLYGSEAVAGLLNIITKDPGKASRFSADVFATGWGEVNTDLGLRYRAGEKGQGLLGLHYFHYQHPMDQNKDGLTDITLQHRLSVFNKWHFRRAAGRVFTLAGRYLYEDRWGGAMDWTPAFRGGSERYGESIFTSRWEVLGVYQLPTRENILLQWSANGHRQNSVYGNVFYLAEQYIGFAQLVWNKSLGKRHQFLAGAALRYTFYDDNTPATSLKPAQKTLPGVFVQDEIDLGQGHKLLLGTRLDYDARHGAIFSPRLNYKWNAAKQRSIVRLGAGNGFRVANVFTEDHAALTGAREVVFAEVLRPETSWNVNLNLVQQVYHRNEVYIGLDFSAFYTFFNNRIVPDYETNPDQIIYANLEGGAVSQGLALNLEMAFGEALQITAGLTALDVSLHENGHKIRQLLTEQWSAVWNIGYQIEKWGLRIDYTGNLYGPMRLPLLGPLDPRPAYSPWWSLQNIQLSKVFRGRWELYGGVKNLLNYTPPANSIARPFDPFDTQVQFDADGQVIPTPDNPQALTFDPTYVFAPNQGIRGFLGLRYNLK